jgi:hypothetical protein
LALELTCFIDKLYGGVGSDEEEPTDTIYILETLWILEVLYANKEEGKLILFAEMKLQEKPGSNLKL